MSGKIEPEAILVQRKFAFCLTVGMGHYLSLSFIVLYTDVYRVIDTVSSLPELGCTWTSLKASRANLVALYNGALSDSDWLQTVKTDFGMNLKLK